MNKTIHFFLLGLLFFVITPVSAQTKNQYKREFEKRRYKAGKEKKEKHDPKAEKEKIEKHKQKTAREKHKAHEKKLKANKGYKQPDKQKDKEKTTDQ